MTSQNCNAQITKVSLFKKINKNTFIHPMNTIPLCQFGYRIAQLEDERFPAF